MFSSKQLRPPNQNLNLKVNKYNGYTSLFDILKFC